MLAAKRSGRAKSSSSLTVRDAAKALIEGMATGSVRNRSRRTYKPSVVRSYEESLRLHVLPRIGAALVSEIGRQVLQRIVDAMHADGLSASTIRNSINPLRVLFKRALRDGEILVDPTRDLELPAVMCAARSVVTPDQAVALVGALSRPSDQAVWSIALFAGLRRGELMALRWEHVDLDTNLIHVAFGWDRLEGSIAPKSRAGVRRVPIIPVLREQLVAWRLASRWPAGLVVGRTQTTPFDPTVIHARARREWAKAKLAPITLHEARHSYASMLIGARTEPRTVMELMGHSSVATTYNIYGHLFPGAHARTGDELQKYIDREIGRVDTHAAPGAAAH